MSTRASVPIAPPDMTFRPASDADLRRLVQLINDAYRPIDWWLFKALRTDEADLRALLADPAVQLIVAEAKGRIAGHIELTMRDGQARLGLLATDVALQGRGIGGALVREAERRARDAGFNELSLECVRENHLEKFYEALGYHVTAEERGRMWNAQQDWTLVTMGKSLR